jgi:hypothetical protein
VAQVVEHLICGYEALSWNSFHKRKEGREGGKGREEGKEREKGREREGGRKERIKKEREKKGRKEGRKKERKRRQEGRKGRKEGRKIQRCCPNSSSLISPEVLLNFYENKVCSQNEKCMQAAPAQPLAGTNYPSRHFPKNQAGSLTLLTRHCQVAPVNRMQLIADVNFWWIASRQKSV